MTTFFSGLLTTSYTYGPTVRVAEASDIIAAATLTGTAPTRVEMLLQVREVDAAVWLTVPSAETGADGVAFEDKPATIAATGGVFFQLPGAPPSSTAGYEVRIAARRVDGDGTTSLVLQGDVRSNKDSPSLAEGVFGAGGSPAYDSATGSLLVTPTRTMADDYTDPEEWVDETNQAAATYYYPSSAGVEMGRYDHLSLTMTLTAGTVTVEMTNDGGTTWQDVTPTVLDMMTGAALAASFTSAAVLDCQAWNCEAIRVKAIMGGGGTNQITIWAKRRKA